ncbi:MAG: lysine transporter LysE [Chitinophaga sp.]|jgi:threonine/homoserine/homoserine lactone efflux protein|nr:lysine transporter LysE [Chitinophaga sp.]
MLAALLKGLALGLLLSVSVGPIIFSIIKQSINKGHKAGYLFVAGISASDITMVLICNSFASLFATLLKHEKAIAIGGSTFLIILGIYSLFFKKPVAVSEHQVKPAAFKKHQLLGIFFSGYLMNILNPGALIFWFAWSAAILADAAETTHPIQYRIIVFGTCLLTVLASDVAKVLLAGKIRSKLTPKNMHRIDQLLGLILIIFGIVLLYGVLQFGNKLHS